MKKIFFPILIALLIVLPAQTYAQTASGPATAPDDQGGYQYPVKIPGQIGVPDTTPVFSGANDSTTDNVQGNATGSKISTTNECSVVKFKSVVDILIWIKCLMVAVFIPMIFAAAFVLFLWGVLKFMYAADAAKKKESQKLIWWGLIGLFVMVSVWGILKIVTNTLGIDPLAVPLLQTDYLKK